MKRFEGKVAIVTGVGSQGMGYYIAKMMAAEGATLVVSDYCGAEVVAEELKATGTKVVAVNADVSTMAGNESLVKAAIDNFGQIDILMCVAGLIRYHAVPTITEEEWDFVVNTNAKGPFALAKYAFPYMKNRDGRIVVFASNAAFGFGLSASYSAAKGAALSFTEAMALEFNQYGIKCNAILPSAVTGLFPMGRIAWAGIPKPEPAGPDMVAPMACYLASQACNCFGEAFYVGGSDVALYPRDRRTVGLIRKGNGEKWTVDELDTMIPETFQWYFDTMTVMDAPDVDNLPQSYPDRFDGR